MSAATVVTIPRTCSRCERKLRASPHRTSDFWVKTRWPDGSPRNYHSRCKDCHVQASTEHRRRQGQKERVYLTPEERADRQRENKRQTAAKTRSDPKRLEAIHRQQKLNARLKRERQREKREGKVDNLVAVLVSRGAEVTERRVSVKGTTTRLTVRWPDGRDETIALAYRKTNQRSTA